MEVLLEPEAHVGAPARGGRWRARVVKFARPFMAIEVAGLEIALISLLFSFEANVPFWQHPAFWISQIEMLANVSALAWAIMIWPRRSEIGAVWASAQTSDKGRRGWLLPLGVNLVLFVVLAVAPVIVTQYAADVAETRWIWLAVYCVPLVATAASLFWLFAPVQFWSWLLVQKGREMLIALVWGALLLTAGGGVQMGGDRLAGVTLMLAYDLLSLYEPTAAVDYDTRSLFVRDFQAIVDQRCSGYEGMGMVAAFLGLYLWSFRATLKFPNALLLVPMGIAAMYALNVMRIVGLVSIGGHLSPELVSGSFDSQAGWMPFLAVTVGFMALAPRCTFFSLGVAGRVRGVAG